jgi:Holliday junction resolvasome RuvABC endonuclease subunit
MPTIVGIDYSLTCPCVCVANNKNFEESYFHFLHENKKYAGLSLNILGDQHDQYLTDQQRYENIASWVLNILAPLDKSNTTILIEDYAFAAKGRVFNLAENCGLLKYLLYKEGYSFHTVAPSVIKKYATGKGNSNKEAMWLSFFELTEIDLVGIYGPASRKVGSPVTDIIDAYYLTRWMYDSLANKIESEKMNRGTNKARKSPTGE